MTRHGQIKFPTEPDPESDGRRHCEPYRVTTPRSIRHRDGGRRRDSHHDLMMNGRMYDDRRRRRSLSRFRYHSTAPRNTAERSTSERDTDNVRVMTSAAMPAVAAPRIYDDCGGDVADGWRDEGKSRSYVITGSPGRPYEDMRPAINRPSSLTQWTAQLQTSSRYIGQAKVSRDDDVTADVSFTCQVCRLSLKSLREFVGHMTSKGHLIQMNSVIREHVTLTRQQLRTLRTERRLQRHL